MTTIARAPALGPPGAYYNLDFSTAGSFADKIGALDDEWKSVVIQPSGADLEMRCDGVAPTLGNGLVISDGEAWLFENQRSILEEAQFFGGTARVHFFGG